MPESFAIYNRSQDLKDVIKTGVSKISDDSTKKIINEHLDDAIIQVSQYRTQFQFQIPTAVKYTLILIAEQCNSINRTQLFKLFNLNCKNVNQVVKQFNDLRMQFDIYNMDRLISTELNECIQSVKSQPHELDDKIDSSQYLELLNRCNCDMSIVLRQRIADFIAIYKETPPCTKHHYNPSYNCISCARLRFKATYHIKPAFLYKALKTIKTKGIVE
jgi:hypothetical protein